jgi:hypothetical protein
LLYTKLLAEKFLVQVKSITDVFRLNDLKKFLLDVFKSIIHIYLRDGVIIRPLLHLEHLRLRYRRRRWLNTWLSSLALRQNLLFDFDLFYWGFLLRSGGTTAILFPQHFLNQGLFGRVKVRFNHLRYRHSLLRRLDTFQFYPWHMLFA